MGKGCLTALIVVIVQTTKTEIKNGGAQWGSWARAVSQPSIVIVQTTKMEREKTRGGGGGGQGGAGGSGGRGCGGGGWRGSWAKFYISCTLLQLYLR